MLRKLLRLNSHCSYFLDYEYSILCEVQNQADPASAHSFCSTALVSHRDYEIWSFPSFQNSTNWIAIALKNLPTIKLIFDVLCSNPWAIWRVGELVNQSANHSQPKCWIFFLWVDHLDLQKAKLYILETRLIFCNIGWITNIFGDFSGANLCESPIFSIYTRCPKKKVTKGKKS